ncbi:cystatin-A5-like [Lithobates pipiens]
MSVPGGWSKPRPATAKDQAIADKVKDQFETMSGIRPSEYKVESVIQLEDVIGTNLWYELDIKFTFVHLNVFDPPPETNEGPKLLSIRLNKNKGDKLGDC